MNSLSKYRIARLPAHRVAAPAGPGGVLVNSSDGGVQRHHPLPVERAAVALSSRSTRDQAPTADLCPMTNQVLTHQPQINIFSDSEPLSEGVDSPSRTLHRFLSFSFPG